jgi:hypothetical protein
MVSTTPALPDSVRQAPGPEAARDLVAWLDQHWLRSESAQVPVSALMARQKVNVLMLEHVSNLLLADEPTLTRRPDGKAVWRVPVDLTFPARGRVGHVAEIDVDAQYGSVFYDDAALAQVEQTVQRLAEQTSHA